MAILETMGGLGNQKGLVSKYFSSNVILNVGMMVGPFLGGLLYEVDGFYFPFVACGGSLIICATVATFIVSDKPDDVVEAQDSKPTQFMSLLKMPSITISCLLLIISEMSVTWYLPTLEPFLNENFDNISTITTGAMFMVEGGTYAIVRFMTFFLQFFAISN